MWLILTCGFDGCGSNAIELARHAEWRAEAAIIGFVDPELSSARQQWYPVDVGDVPEGTRFNSQTECLRALRRAMPEGETTEGYGGDWSMGWETENVIHAPDHIEQFAAVGRGNQANMVRTYLYACFQEGPRVG